MQKNVGMPGAGTLAVALVEDDLSFRGLVRAAIATAADLRLEAEAGDLRGGLALLAGPAADVLIVDLGLPDGSGVDMIRAARATWPHCEVIVATVFGDEGKVLSAIEAGAHGYLLKDALPDSLVDEIRSVHAGGSPVSPMIARQLLRRMQPASAPVRATPADADELLSGREVQVLERMALGYTMLETADFLGVAMSTVQTYVRRIYLKLGVNSKVEAIDAGYRRGLLQGR
ncbi:response regulator transcription factor [uncultured Rhodoferax sp.]|uniref:response regulator n=1 Tax=uncultured Rhodoferax sp. TaxID=223188 RepID=UPI0025FB54F1|nr:response regulator transcription factor [uncultured Rhodoferax sp.]